MKTSNEILTDVRAVVSTVFSGQGLTGGIYKKTRPTDSQLEDTILTIIPGNVGKFVKDGAIYIKTFYADINLNNTYFENSNRGQYIEDLYQVLSDELLNKTGYFFDYASREIYTEKVEELNEHYCILIMNFKILN